MNTHILDRFHNLTFIVLGDAMLDVYIKGSSHRLCREAPIPIVAVEEKQERAGGAANTAVNVASLGATCHLISTIGNDLEGESLVRILKKEGVYTDEIQREERKTLSKQRVFAQNHLLLRFDHGNYQEITQKTEGGIITTLTSLYSESDGIIISDYGYGVITPRVLEIIQKLQAQFHKILVIDAKNIKTYQTLHPTLVKPNFEEAVTLLELSNLPTKNRIAYIKLYEKQILEKTGTHIAAVTVDNEGSIIFQQNKQPYQTSTTPVDNANATGAGDTYSALFALALASNSSTQEAADLAAVGSEIVIQKNLTAACTQDDIEIFLSSSSKQLHNSEKLPNFIQKLKDQKKRIIFTNGCFDILHSGHITYLTHAKKLGDILIVGLNSDESVKRLKGDERPINSLPDRIRVLSGLSSVDFIIPFSENTPISLITKISPDVYVKGGDYTRETLPEVPIVESLGGRVEIIPYVKAHSTTQIIHDIREKKSGKHSLFS